MSFAERQAEAGKPPDGSGRAQHLLGDPDEVIQGERVLHLRYPVCR